MTQGSDACLRLFRGVKEKIKFSKDFNQALILAKKEMVTKCLMHLENY